MLFGLKSETFDSSLGFYDSFFATTFVSFVKSYSEIGFDSDFASFLNVGMKFYHSFFAFFAKVIFDFAFSDFSSSSYY